MKIGMGAVNRFLLILTICLSLTGGLTQSVEAVTCTWQGTTTDWYQINNWNGCLDQGGNPKVPGGVDDVIIPDSASAYPVLTRYQDVIGVNTLTINAGAHLTIDEQTTIQANQFDNSGTITIVETGGHNLRINAPFNNYGSANIGSEAALILYQNGTHTGSFTGRQLSFVKSGAVQVNTFQAGSSIAVNVLMVGDNNTVNVEGQYHCLENIYINAGSTVDLTDANILNQGTIHLRGGTLITNAMTIPTGGTFSGTGTLETTLINSGTISPGSSPGTLTVEGDYTQESSGSLAVELGGITPDTEYDQLIVTGLATLEGSLALTYYDEFLPTVGQSFAIMTYTSKTGTFDDVSFPPVAANLEWTLAYNETALVLSLVEKEENTIFLPLVIH